jgi:hypothetical protein
LQPRVVPGVAHGNHKIYARAMHAP